MHAIICGGVSQQFWLSLPTGKCRHKHLLLICICGIAVETYIYMIRQIIFYCDAKANTCGICTNIYQHKHETSRLKRDRPTHPRPRQMKEKTECVFVCALSHKGCGCGHAHSQCEVHILSGLPIITMYDARSYIYFVVFVQQAVRKEERIYARILSGTRAHLCRVLAAHINPVWRKDYLSRSTQGTIIYSNLHFVFITVRKVRKRRVYTQLQDIYVCVIQHDNDEVDVAYFATFYTITSPQKRILCAGQCNPSRHSVVRKSGLE